MSWDSILYYAGYLVAVVLCRGLGKIFFIPMLLNMGFNIALQAGLLSEWDIRGVMVAYGFVFFLWVSALSGIFDRVTVILLLMADLFTAYLGIFPQLAKVGDGGHFWDITSTSIVEVWLVSILVVSTSAIVKSSLVHKIQHGYSSLLVNPKRRFLIPIAMWAAMFVLPDHFGNLLPDFIRQNHFKIAGQLLVWGWVAFELPFYIMYKRMRDYAE